MTVFKISLWNYDLSINMALVNEGYLHYTDMKKFSKIPFLWNRLSDFEIISQKCSLCDPSQELLAKFWLVYKRGSGSVFTNNSLERSLSYSPDFSIFRSIWMKHNFWLAKPYGLANQKLCYIQICKSWRQRQRMFLRMVGEYGPWWVGATRTYTHMKEFFKNLLLCNSWSDFEIISQKCSLGNHLQKLLAEFRYVSKHGSGEWGLLALYRCL